MTKAKCIHVEFKGNGAHFYFGSIAAIYDLFSYEDLGVHQERLYDFNVEKGKPYKNSKVIIRKGDFRRKRTARGEHIIKLHKDEI